MTNDEFWKLYDSGEIQTKVWEGKEGDATKEVCSFQYEGKFFLRITESMPTKSWYSQTKHRYTHRRGWVHSVIKEFNTASQANNYFKKCFSDCSKYSRVK